MMKIITLAVVFTLVSAVLAEQKLPEKTFRIPKSDVEFTMVKIPAGKVTYKDKEGKEITADVKSIWIGKHEVKWEEYIIFAERLDMTDAQKEAKFDAVNRPSQTYYWPKKGPGESKGPATSMFFVEAVKYCRWLGKKFENTKFRVPTEAEWVYACNAGGEGVKMTQKELREVAWYATNSDSQPQEVGTKKPNAWGLHDMLGNVSEWVMRDAKDDKRMVIGGSWDDDAENVTVASRKEREDAWQNTDPNEPKGRSWFSDANFIGFRIVMEE